MQTHSIPLRNKNLINFFLIVTQQFDYAPLNKFSKKTITKFQKKFFWILTQLWTRKEFPSCVLNTTPKKKGEKPLL